MNVAMLKPDACSRIRRARWEAGLKQKELAKKADVHPATLSRIENGDRKIDGLTIYKLAAHLPTLDPDSVIEPAEQSA